MADAGELEERTVEVNDPKLTADANRRLTEAVREVLGTDRVRVPANRPRVSQGDSADVPWYQDISIFRTAGLGSVSVAIGVGLIILLTTAHWYLLAIAIVVLVIVLASMTRAIILLASTTEYPDPFLVALLAEQGMRDPETRFTEYVREFTPVSDDEERSTRVEDDPAQASAEQAAAGTPSGGSSSAVGPGS